MIRYVVGLVFDKYNAGEILLQEKAKPEWQAGRLNGPGGKIEAGETPEQAMAREFAEECSIVSQPEEWTQIAIITRQKNWEVVFLTIRCDTALAKAPAGAEPLVWTRVENLWKLRQKPIQNLFWLFPLAMDTTITKPIQVQDTYP